MSCFAVSKMLHAAMEFAKLSATSTMHRRFITCSSSTPRLIPHPPDLIRWIRREGGFVHSTLRISNHGSDGLCISSSGEISAGSEIISLPSHIPLTFQRFTDPDDPDSILIKLSEKIPEELWTMRLGLRLLQERASAGSFWWPYISNLPEAFSVPIFFALEDMKSLQYAPLVFQVNKRCCFLLEFEKEVKALLESVEPKCHPFNGQDVNASSLGWAMSAVSSRAFCLHGEIRSDGQKTDIHTLLPLIDMCNHSFQPNAKIVQEHEKGSLNMAIKVVSETTIDKDSPVTLNYGCLSNDIFLLDYGFVIPSNPYDHVELKYDGTLLDVAGMVAGISSPNFSSPAKWQQEILCHLNLFGGAIAKVSLGGSEVVDGRLLATLRVLLANNEETVKNLNFSTLMELSEGAPLGICIEIAALRIIIALCSITLQHFPTKIMQDESILKETIPPLLQLAVQFRMQKKLTIIDVIRKLSQKIKTLAKPSS